MVTESKRQMLKEMAEMSADDLSRDQKLVLEYADIFAEDGELGRTNKMKHLINTGDARPIASQSGDSHSVRDRKCKNC